MGGRSLGAWTGCVEGRWEMKGGGMHYADRMHGWVEGMKMLDALHSSGRVSLLSLDLFIQS